MEQVSYPHRIRLRDPWQSEPCQDPGGRLFRRKFGRPGRIDSHERLWLTFSCLKVPAEIWLNGECLANKTESEEIEFEVTSRLAQRNEMTIELETEEQTDKLPVNVALEIRCAAFLRDVGYELASNGRVIVRGTVCGESSPLELYALVDNRTAAYMKTPWIHSATHFLMTLDESVVAAASRNPMIRIELVNGGTVWYRCEGTLTAG